MTQTLFQSNTLNASLHDHNLRNRVRQLFTFLRALIQQRFPAPRQISERALVLPLSRLPNHESVRFSSPGEEADKPLLYVERPQLISCPEPPEVINNWLEQGWNTCHQSPKVIEKKIVGKDDAGAVILDYFKDDLKREEALNNWIEKRHVWAEERARAEQALQLFDCLYQQFAVLEKEGGQIELLVGDGMLNWRLPAGGIHHPILIKRVELRFDPVIPAFSLVDSDRPVEVYNSLLLSIDEIDIKRLQERCAELKIAQYHPLGETDTSAFLKALVQSLSPTYGEFLDSPAVGEKSHPRIWREPILFSSKRNLSYGTAIDAILQDIEKAHHFPRSLAAIVGIYKPTGWMEQQIGQKEEQVLLAKPANVDQINIVRRLHKTGLVHVQGPPGAGKTHTIGNIIGHLLAQGKRILVTSQTEKALRVLKEKVPEPLQSLCVSVLGNDREGRKQLEETINEINNRLSRQDPQALLNQCQRKIQEREALLLQEKTLRGRLKAVIDSEYNAIEIDGLSLDPSAAAREIVSTQAGNDWIPGKAGLNDPLPLYPEEFAFLYASNDRLTLQDEIELKRGLVNSQDIPAPDVFSLLISDYRALMNNDLRAHEDYWSIPDRPYHSLKTAADHVFAEFDQSLIKQAWRPSAIIAGMLGEKERLLWETLCQRIERTADLANRLALLEHLKPAINEDIGLEQSIEICQQIKTYLTANAKFGMMTLLLRRDWKRFIQSARVVSGEPNRQEHFEALCLVCEIKIARREISHLWDQLIASQGGKSFDSLGAQPEFACRAIIPEIRRCLNWYNAVWVPLLSLLSQEGLNLPLLSTHVQRQESPLADYLQIEEMVIQRLPAIICSELSRRRIHEIEQELSRYAQHFDSAENGLNAQFLQALRTKDVELYQQSYARLIELNNLKGIYDKRQACLQKLHAAVPQWALAIANRLAPHDQSVLPGNLLSAWRWLRLSFELCRRQEENLYSIQQDLEKCQDRIRQITLDLIESLTWGKQIQLIRSQPELQQSLAGWLELQRKLNSTRIKSIQQKLKTAAQRELATCSQAVPVWIMPLHAIAENIDPTTTKFDVIIIDEASQANLLALIPMYMADEAIVVGDHEQTTPEAAGIQQAPVHHLIETHLQGIPNSELFDLLTSIYDLARRCFGETILLTEHFRCVPEIIGFSNHLSYEGKILPLREETSSLLNPATVTYRVDGTAYKKQNEAEAEAIARLINAMTQHPAYEEATIGVISLLGEEQARLIDAKLRAGLSASEYLKRRIVCGNPPQFQGDERDVIFLSMVDSMGEEAGFLRKKGEGAFDANKKRFNVAASRARDQLWVVHSMDPICHLKPDDIRRNLILYAQNPQAVLQGVKTEIEKADSIFEIEVMEQLAQKGYRVKAQWEVGYHRIDIVVVGESKRLAIECDGDRWHPPEKREMDLERQAILERLGWTFVRIRGSFFFLDPIAAMKPVFDKLEAMKIERLGPDAHSSIVTDRRLISELEQLAWPERFQENVSSTEFQ
ncbi:AAA domain-containing protein [Candidatus Protochlamydia phocaeensis]|uniref:AAA domain-containing protein n=1 Tax=Candidatus Protochlamydia phocaeensis TaxID=1414722 RepID=UPI000839A476|nr:AAA domain-containing protein [Candidatus Protochlamydia phocaeensis]